MEIYEVVSYYYDDKPNQFILNVIETDSIPINRYESFETCDIYHDYFTNRAVAERFVSDSKKCLI